MKRSRSGSFRRAVVEAARPLVLDYIRQRGRDRRSQSAPPDRSASNRRRRAARGNPVQVAISGGNSGGNPKPQRMKTKRKGKPVKTLKQLKKKVNKIAKNLNCNNSVFNSFSSDSFSLSSAINRCGLGSYIFIGPAEIEATLAKIPYANIATLGTRQEVNVTGAYQHTKWCVKTSTKYCIRNNYLHPVVVDAYVCKPKSSTGVGPHTQVDNGFDRMAVAGGIINRNPSLYPTHSKLFVDGWKILRHEKVTLEAGSEIIMAHYETFKNYDPKYCDIYTDPYLPKYSRHLMVRIQGVCAHDVTNDSLVGISEAKVDIVMFRKIQIVYPGNFAPLQTIADSIQMDAVADDEVAAQNGIVHDDL